MTSPTAAAAPNLKGLRSDRKGSFAGANGVGGLMISGAENGRMFLNGAAAAKCAAGDPRQMQRIVELISRHRSALVNHVRRILGCAEDAEDVVQETCVRLMRVRDFWRGERQVRAFLFKIATNLARDELRRRRACAYGAHFPYDTIELVGDGLQPDEIVDRHLAMEAISHALTSLPARHREVFNLHVQAQLSYRAISKRLGISTKTVERDMCGARELCQDRLGSATRPSSWPALARRMVRPVGSALESAMKAVP